MNDEILFYSKKFTNGQSITPFVDLEYNNVRYHISSTDYGKFTLESAGGITAWKYNKTTYKRNAEDIHKIFECDIGPGEWDIYINDGFLTIQMENTMKLNLAAGTDLKPFPWVNLDIVARWPGTDRGCDIIWDARKDKIPFADNSVDEIYASYLLLHLAPRFHASVLAEIHRVLMPDGVLVVGEVDMRKVMAKYLENPFDPSMSDLIWGEQAIRPEWPVEQADELAEFDKHCQGFTEETLKKTLTDAGFTGFTPRRLHAVFYELTLACKKIVK